MYTENENIKETLCYSNSHRGFAKLIIKLIPVTIFFIFNRAFAFSLVSLLIYCLENVILGNFIPLYCLTSVNIGHKYVDKYQEKTNRVASSMHVLRDQIEFHILYAFFTQKCTEYAKLYEIFKVLAIIALPIFMHCHVCIKKASEKKKHT